MPFVLWGMSLARILLTLVVVSIGSARAYAQEGTSPSPMGPSHLRAIGTYWFGSPLTFDRGAPSLLSVGTTINGTSKDHSYGVAGELGFSVTDNWTLLVQPGYRIGSGEFTSDPLVDPQERLTVSTEYTTFDMGLLMSYDISNWLKAVGGGSLSVYPSSTATHTRIALDTTEIIAIDGDLLGKPIHFSVPLGARLTLFESSNISLGVDLLGAINVTEAIRGYAASSLKAGGSVWLAFSTTSPEPPTIKEPISIKDSIFTPIKPRLSASTRFLVNEVDADSISVTTIDTVVTTSLVIPQSISFDQGSSTAGNGPIDLQTLLAEIGKRLNEKPEAQLTIELRRSASEPANTTMERARSLKCIIGSDRITIITSGKPISELGYALLKTTDPLILAPIRTRETMRDQRVDHLSIDRSTIAEAGVQEWAVVILNGRDTLVQYGNSPTLSDEATDLSFSLPVTTTQLTLYSYVLDRAGQRSESFDTLYVRPTSTTSEFVTIDEYLLPGQPKPPGQEWSFEQSILDHLIQSVTPSTVIEISSLFPSGIDRIPALTEMLLENCQSRGVLPQKIEVSPMNKYSDSERSAVRQTWGNTLLIRVKS